MAAWEALLDRLVADGGAARESRQDGCGERRDGGGVELSAVVYLDVECGRLATSPKSKVRYREQPGKHMLVPSFTHFDPFQTTLAFLTTVPTALKELNSVVDIHRALYGAGSGLAGLPQLQRASAEHGEVVFQHFRA